MYKVRTTFLKPPSWKSQYWFDSEDGQIKEFIDTRRRACKKYLQTKPQESKNRYTKSKAVVRQALRTMENSFWKKKCEDIQLYADKGNTHKLYQEIKHIWSLEMQNADSIILEKGWECYLINNQNLGKTSRILACVLD